MDLIICQDCGKEFKKSAKLQRHMRETHQNLKPFKCEICQREFKRNFHLKRHEASHSDNPKPVACTMEDCTRRFSNKYHLARHIKIVHDQDRYRCQFCDVSFKKKRFLQQHMSDTHSSIYNNQSTMNSFENPAESEQPYLSDEFSSQKRVKIAPDQYEVIFTPHKESKDFELTSLEFHDLLNSLKHAKGSEQSEVQQQSREIFKCGYENCSKTFSNLTRLKSHVRTSHIKSYKCEQPGCQAKFHRKGALTRHCSEKHGKIQENTTTTSPYPFLTTANDYFELSRPSYTDFLNLEDSYYDFLQDSPLRNNLPLRQDELDNL